MGSTTKSCTCWGLSQDRGVWPVSPNTVTGQTATLLNYLHTQQHFLEVASHITVLFSSDSSSRLLSADGKVAERRAAESVRAAGITRKEVQWSWSCVWLCDMAWRRHMEVPTPAYFLSVHDILNHFSSLFTDFTTLSSFCCHKGCSRYFRVWRPVPVHCDVLLQRETRVCHIRKCWDA